MKSRVKSVNEKMGNGAPWNRIRNRGYNLGSRKLKRTILIVCEGYTEVYYFQSFRLGSLEIECVPTGRSKMSLVKKAEDLSREREYEEVWCVFDFDHDPRNPSQINDYNSAIDSARKKGFSCAYSNDCFELWYLLHFNLVEGRLTRSQISIKLGKLLLVKDYAIQSKKAASAKEIVNKIATNPKANQMSAISNARRLHDNCKNRKYHEQNPVTLIYKLVQRLNANR